MIHSRQHWIAVTLVAGLALLAFEAAGQNTTQMSPNAAAVFQGRPAMSGAQSGHGAMAGPPTGGIGLQGSDGAGRSLRYFEWIFDPDPADTTYTNDFAYMLREGNGPVCVEHDTHVMGLFSREEWLESLRAAGFQPRVLEDPYEREVFVAVAAL